MNILSAALSSANDEGTWLNTAGFLGDRMNIVAIALLVIGAIIIYFAVKLMKGYTFHTDETVVVDKTEGFETVNAVIAQRRQTEIPNYSSSAKGGGNDVFKEMLIVYTVGGEEYSQWVSDYGEDMYKDTVPIKYDPEDPENFFIYTEDDDFKGIPDENGELDGNEEDTDDTAEEMEVSDKNNSVAVVVLIIGILIMAIGGFILADWLGIVNGK